MSQRKKSSGCYSSKPTENQMLFFPGILWDLAPALPLVISNFRPQVSPILLHTHTPANLILQSTLNFSLFPSLSHARSSIKWPMVQLCFQLASITGRSGMLQSMETLNLRTGTKSEIFLCPFKPHLTVLYFVRVSVNNDY